MNCSKGATPAQLRAVRALEKQTTMCAGNWPWSVIYASSVWVCFLGMRQLLCLVFRAFRGMIESIAPYLYGSCPALSEGFWMLLGCSLEKLSFDVVVAFSPYVPSII